MPTSSTSSSSSSSSSASVLCNHHICYGDGGKISASTRQNSLHNSSRIVQLMLDRQEVPNCGGQVQTMYQSKTFPKQYCLSNEGRSSVTLLFAPSLGKPLYVCPLHATQVCTTVQGLHPSPLPYVLLLVWMSHHCRQYSSMTVSCDLELVMGKIDSNRFARTNRFD